MYWTSKLLWFCFAVLVASTLERKFNYNRKRFTSRRARMGFSVQSLQFQFWAQFLKTRILVDVRGILGSFGHFASKAANLGVRGTFPGWRSMF